MEKLFSFVSARTSISAIVAFSALVSSCGDSSTSPADKTIVVPLAAEVTGLTLTGPLAGKKVYKLDSSINLPGCWQDSANWTGSELYYGLSSTNFTRLLAGQGIVDDPTCTLPREQVNGDHFDTYKARLVNGAWQTTYLNIDPVNTDAGASVSGNTMAFTLYDPAGDWDIYLTQQISDDAWDTPVAFARNSTCQEDNAQLYANGTKIIFESTRLDAAGSSCEANSDNKSLWFSQKTDSTWSLPTLIPGDPNLGDKNTQPWVDEANGYLYWTSDTECACIRRIAWVDDAPVGNFETVVTPAIETLTQGTADGKIVFVGEYSQANGYAFVACAQATEAGDGSDPALYDGKWSIDVDLCVIPEVE